MSDHYAEAVDADQLAMNSTKEMSRMWHRKAQVHAVLALAEQLAAEDIKMRHELVKARREAGISQNDLAKMLGIKQSSVAAFERYDNDPRLSTIRRYALAVGAEIHHEVTTDVSLKGCTHAAKIAEGSKP